MNVESVKLPKKRIDVPDYDNLGILYAGSNNLYYEIAEMIIRSSGKGSTCLERYESFVRGSGFRDKDFATLVVNNEGQTMDDLYFLAAKDMANFHGFCIHVKYNVFLEPVEYYHLPFLYTRLCQYDEDGRISKICVFDDWLGEKKKNGERIKPTRETVDYIDVFDSNKDVVRSQIEAAGGIDEYKGQVIWFSLDGKFVYPRPKYDKVISQLSSDEGLSNIVYRNIRCNFQPSSLLVVEKNTTTEGTIEEKVKSEKRADKESDALVKGLEGLQGDENLGKVLVYKKQRGRQSPEKIDLSGKNYDKEFSVSMEYLEIEIFIAFEQEYWYRLLKGSVGFGLADQKSAFDYYNTVTNPQRSAIERVFEDLGKLMGKSYDKIVVEPMIYLYDGEEDKKEIVDVMTSSLTKEEKKGVLSVLYRVSDDKIKKLFGE